MIKETKSKDNNGVVENKEKKEKEGVKRLKKNLKELKLKLKKTEEDLLLISKNCDKYLNSWKKVEAELLNYKRLEQIKINDLLKYNIKIIISDLIPVLVNFQRAINYIPKEKQEENSIKGLLYIEKELKSILEQYGLKRIELKDKFDPNFHEIIKSSEQEKIDLNKNYKIEEIEAGYILNNKVIKPTKIKIIYT